MWQLVLDWSCDVAASLSFREKLGNQSSVKEAVITWRCSAGASRTRLCQSFIESSSTTNQRSSFFWCATSACCQLPLASSQQVHVTNVNSRHSSFIHIIHLFLLLTSLRDGSASFPPSLLFEALEVHRFNNFLCIHSSLLFPNDTKVDNSTCTLYNSINQSLSIKDCKKMIASSKALSLFLAVAAASLNYCSVYGFAPIMTGNNAPSSSSSSSLAMLENTADYSSMASFSTTSSSSSSDKPNIAPPPLMSPPQQQEEEQNAFFASPSDENSMQIEMSTPAMSTTTVATTTTTTTAVKKVAKFHTDGGIMMECIRPFPTVHKVTPLSLGHKKAGFKKEGIMMAATSSLPKPTKKDNNNSSSPLLTLQPKESSSMQPNTSSFQWKPAAVTPDGKLQWKQREIDCMPMPAE
jgi:hypothetical protein